MVKQNSEIMEVQNSVENFNAIPFDELKRTPLDKVIEMAQKTVKPKSWRVYEQTFRVWKAWCDENRVHPIDINPMNVTDFLLDQKTTKSTRQRQLSSLRKLAEIMAIIDGETAKQNYQLLKMMKVPEHDKKVENSIRAEKSRKKTALSASEADTLLRVWQENTLTSIRNRALIALLLATGLRRAELVSLQWRDVDLTSGVVHVEDGKRGKSRDVPILNDFAVLAVDAWKKAQQTAHENQAETEPPAPRDFVFCSVGKGDRLLDDTSTHPDTVWRVVKKTGKIAGIEWSPHDGRRTVITDTAETAGVKSAQQIAGHSDVSTTLGYVGTVDAKELKNRVKLRYGAVTKHDKKLLTTEPLLSEIDAK